MRESELVLNGSYSKSTQPKARAPPEQPALLTIYLTFMFNKNNQINYCYLEEICPIPFKRVQTLELKLYIYTTHSRYQPSKNK